MKLNPIAANMTTVEVGTTTVLFSYQTPVAAFVPGSGIFKTSKKWSATTSRHINKWIALDYSPNVTITEQPQEYFDNLLNGVKS